MSGLGLSKVVNFLEFEIILKLFSAQHRSRGIMFESSFLGSKKRLLCESYSVGLIVVINELLAECLIKTYAESLAFRYFNGPTSLEVG